MKEKPRLTEEQFRKAYQNPDIHKIINQQASRFAKNRKTFRDEIKQDGWLSVFFSSSTEDLLENARKGVRNAYEREWYDRKKGRDYYKEHYENHPDFMGDGNYYNKPIFNPSGK